MDNLLQLTALAHSAFDLTENDNLHAVIKCELKLLKMQKAVFSPGLVAASNKLPLESKLRAKVTSYLQGLLNSSILTGKGPRLEYLQLQVEKPKALPTFAPQIEDDFLIAGRWKEN